MKNKLKIAALTFRDGFSGINQPIFENLKPDWDLEIIDAFYIPPIVKLINLARSFSFNRLNWGNRYYQNLALYTKRPETFLLRTKRCRQQLERLKEKPSLVFQISALFSALEGPVSPPYVIYIDFTSKLAEEHYPEWVPFRSEGERKRWHELEKGLYDRVDLILVFNRAVEQSLLEHYGASRSKIRVTGSGVNLKDLSDFDKSYEPTLLFVGRDFKRHGGEIALKAFGLIRRKVKGVKLLIAGADFKTGDDNILTLGNLDKQKLDLFYRSSSILLMPAKIGGLQTVLEAMARKCCCVVSQGNPHLTDVIEDQETGVITPFGDEKKLAERTISLLEDRDLLRKIGEKGYLQVRENYAWDKVVRKMSREFLELLEIVK